MIPVLSPEETREVDRRAPDPVDVLVERAGHAVASAARDMLSGCYGRRVVVVAGPGNNGADGRVAARVLESRGAKVAVLDAAGLGPGARLPPADLVVDAAFGTGLSRPYSPFDAGEVPVLSVDIPSGLSGTTGQPIAGGGAVRAQCTVTFASMKPGLLLGEGRERAGAVTLAGIGLEGLAAEAANAWLVIDGDVIESLPPRPHEAHKWQAAVTVISGSPGMPGAPTLVSTAALRAGAGYVLVGVPGAPAGGGMPPGEYVAHGLPESDWGPAGAELGSRAQALVVGPGLGELAGPGSGEAGPVASFLRSRKAPAVVDADAITALGSVDAVRSVADASSYPIVVTPHAGEYSRLTGHPPSDDRVADVRETASRSGAVVLLKGSTTVVAEPGGRVLLAAAGSPRLATAGTGDVLSGMIGAFIARGIAPFEAAALAAHCHGRAAATGPAEGLVASDLPGLLSRWLSRLGSP